MRAWIRLSCLLACALGLLAAPADAGALGLRTVGAFDQPTYVTSPPGDPRLFVVERGGTIEVVRKGASSRFLDISALVGTGGERGLLSMAFDPRYRSNGLFYVFYNDSGAAGAGEGDIHVDEFRVGQNPALADPASRRPVLTIGHGDSVFHNGGQLQFGKDGLLYISAGDAGDGANAQATDTLLGKILRIDPHGAGPGDYTSPASNPFAGGAPGADEIWALGLRNPFRFSFDRLTGDLALADVGSNVSEEIDFAPRSAGLARGANFGWPACEGLSGTGCAGPAFTGPVFAYPHSPPCNAIIGGFVYRGSRIPGLAGRYVYSDHCHIGLRSIKLRAPRAKGDRAEGAAPSSNVISFGQDANCELYLVSTGLVQRIVGPRSDVAPHCVKKCRKRGSKQRRKPGASTAKKRKQPRCGTKRKKGSKSR